MVLLRVGVDSACGGTQSPLFDDGTFELLCIPDSVSSVDPSSATYGSKKDKFGRPLTQYVGAKFRETRIHLDPEFESMTYGDPTSPKRGLAKLTQGDYLVFTCGLQRWRDGEGWIQEDQPHIYLAGFFVVEIAEYAKYMDTAMLESYFSRNAHCHNKTRLDAERDRLLLIKGGKKSRRFSRAVRISDIGTDAAGNPLKVLSREMRQHFGDFGGKNSLQRSTPRWIKEPFTESAIRFLSSLE